jgi:hypothetical protein
MPPFTSDRFQLQVRLGRDGDIEEWLGSDTTLDIPVLIRHVGPEASPARQAEFLGAVTAAASVSHDHIAAVLSTGHSDGGVYAVEEWSGGVSVGDRIAANDPLPVEEYLPNAAGLAGALAALHAAGSTHGSIGPRTIEFSTAHPAKLRGLGRVRHTATAAEDTAALADVLSSAVTGDLAGDEGAGIAPSDLRAGIPVSVDTALQRARDGELDAAELAARLRAAPTTAPPGQHRWSWRWLGAAAVLVLVAILVALVGSALRVRPSDAPLLFPAGPVSSQPSTTTSAPPATAPSEGPDDEPELPPVAVPVLVGAYDPFGDEVERGAEAALAADDDLDTAWRTERYFDPLPRVKPGVGLTFQLAGSPGRVEITASEGISYRLAWAREIPEEFDSWEETTTGRLVDGRASHRLPARTGGVWLLWMTDLPDQEAGQFFYADVFDVRFLS